jgi:hypothetical protein
MASVFTGRSSLLTEEIDQLQQEIEWHNKSGIPGQEEIQDERSQRLAALRQELKLELGTKRLVVLGTMHNLQLVGHHQNAEFLERLLFLIEKFSVTAIMEEWTEDQPPSVASQLAGGPVRYKDVGTPHESAFRTYQFHPINHPAHDGILGSCFDAPSMSEYGPIDRQQNREQRMVTNIRGEMEGHRAGIFIVGLAHLHSMSTKLKEAGFNVSAYSWLG